MVVEGVVDCFGRFSRRCLFRILSVGPLPTHFAFIMDGNRRYAKKEGLETCAGHKVGYSALMSLLGYCYELGVKYVTVYAFSIDNFKRQPAEVESLMDLMLEKVEELVEKDSIVKQHGVRVYFIGNLTLLNPALRAAMEKVMSATSLNSRAVLLVCVAYTSLDEIVNAVQHTCVEMHSAPKPEPDPVPCKSMMIDLDDIEKRMLMAVAPSPDLVIRSSGEMRLSNFLLWQTGGSALYSPTALWPEIGLRHLVWAIIHFQKNYLYLEKVRKQL